MKKLLISISATLLAVAAFADPVLDVKAGTDLAVRCSGGTFTIDAPDFGASTTSDLILPGTASTLAHIPKAAAGLTASVAMGTLFPALGITTTLTFTGATDATTGGIAWTVSDPTEIGKTISVTYKGVPYSVVVTGISGTVYTVGSALGVPVLDPFDHVYRGTGLLPDPAHVSSVVISGSAEGVIPVTVTLNPDISGIGGASGEQFVLSVNLTGNAVNLVSDVTYTGQVNLELPAVPAGVTVALTGNLFTGLGSVLVPGGKQSVGFSFRAESVGSEVPGWITATAGGHSFTRTLNVLPLLASIEVGTVPAISGAPVEFVIHLNTKAPAPFVITLHSDDPNLTVPASIPVPLNATSVTFTATPAVVGTGTTLTATTPTYVSATYGGTIVRTLLSLH